MICIKIRKGAYTGLGCEGKCRQDKDEGTKTKNKLGTGE